jgi:CRP-like cAMP-binding protein
MADAMDFSKLRNVLQGVDFLFHLKVTQLDLLVNAMRRETVKAGAVVIRQGDRGDKFYVVASGKLSVWIKRGLKQVQVDTRWPEQFFGEMALVGNKPRMATVKAEQDCELYVLSKEDFASNIMSNKGIAQQVRVEMVKRAARSI